MAHPRTMGRRRLRRLAVLGGLVAALTAYRNRAIEASRRQFAAELDRLTGAPSSNGQVLAGSAVPSH